MPHIGSPRQSRSATLWEMQCVAKRLELGYALCRGQNRRIRHPRKNVPPNLTTSDFLVLQHIQIRPIGVGLSNSSDRVINSY